MLLAAFLLSIAGDAGKGVPRDTFEAVSSDEMAARMKACGFEKVEISYQDYVQSDVVQIGDRAIGDEQMRCLVENTRKTSYLVEVDPGSRARYYELLGELWRPEQLARIRAWLAERPELGPPPDRLEGESDDLLAERIEDFCGDDADGAFAREFGVLTLSGDWLMSKSQNRDLDTFECILNTAFLANLPLGFVGNEKFVEDN